MDNRDGPITQEMAGLWRLSPSHLGRRPAKFFIILVQQKALEPAISNVFDNE